MKILAINGSYRGHRGQTGGFLRLLLSGAEIAGAECEEIILADLEMHHCLGCDTCHKPEHYLSCVYAQKDGVEDVFRKIAEADLLIYATPVYVFGISSLMKTFLDRLYSTSDVNQLRVTRSGMFFHHVDETICSKPFVPLICCDNLDAQMPVNVRDYFRTYARFMDAPLAGELIRNGARMFGDLSSNEHPEIFPRIPNVINAYQQAGFELATNGVVSKKTQRAANQEIIPVPGFGLLKRLRAFKRVMVFQAKDILSRASEK